MRKFRDGCKIAITYFNSEKNDVSAYLITMYKPLNDIIDNNFEVDGDGDLIIAYTWLDSDNNVIDMNDATYMVEYTTVGRVKLYSRRWVKYEEDLIVINNTGEGGYLSKESHDDKEIEYAAVEWSEEWVVSEVDLGDGEEVEGL